MSGWTLWGIGEVVEAADFQNYIQDQVVQTYAGTAARTASLGTFVAEGMVSYLADTNTLQFYNGAAWENVSAPGDITSVSAGTALSGGGSSGDVTLNVNLAAVGSSVLASPNMTGTAVIAAGTVTGNLVIGGDLKDVGWTTLRALATDASGNAVTSSVTSTELGYVSGVTSAIQTQLNAKVSTTNGTVSTATAGSAVVRNITLGTATPGTAVGMDGDVFLVYTP
jgi:hypothetical protein